MSECARPDGRCPFLTPCTGRCYAAKRIAAQATAERRKAVRTFPLQVWPNSGKFGWCRWCGDEITRGQVRSRMWHDGRAGEPDCKFQWQLHTDPRVQYPFLVARDGEKCADCGEAPGAWLRGMEVIVYLSPAERATWPLGERGPTYREIRWKIALEIEHDVPLWSVAHLPDEERRPYFGPDHLKLRCVACHKPKTAEEAGARAKGNRQAKMRIGVSRETATAKGRGIPQRAKPWPDKGKGAKLPSRPLRSRNDLKRR